MTRMFVSLGSNVRPEANVPCAVDELRRAFHVVAVSRAYRTAPVGDADQPDFWNLAAEIESALPPGQVQAQLREIEDRLGRVRDPRRPFGPRTADLDLVLVEGVSGRFGALELPSPLLEREAFVAVPVAELAPDMPHPVLGAPLADLAREASARASRPPQPVGPAEAR